MQAREESGNARDRVPVDRRFGLLENLSENAGGARVRRYGSAADGSSLQSPQPSDLQAVAVRSETHLQVERHRRPKHKSNDGPKTTAEPGPHELRRAPYPARGQGRNANADIPLAEGGVRARRDGGEHSSAVGDEETTSSFRRAEAGKGGVGCRQLEGRVVVQADMSLRRLCCVDRLI